PFAARELLARVSANIQMARMRREAAREVMRSEQRFLMTQDRLGAALSSGGIAVFDMDIENSRAIVLGPLTRFFGVAEEDAAKARRPGVYVEGIDAPDRRRVQAAITQSIKADEPYEVEYCAIGGDKPRRMLARGGPRILSDGSRRFIGAIIDVSAE